jgi:ABC-2 type transport system permease protein
VTVFDPAHSQLVSLLRASARIDVREAASPEEVEAEVRQGSVAGFLVPSDFDAHVRAGERPPLVVYVNSERGAGQAAIVRQTLEDQLRVLAGQEVPARLTWTDVSPSPVLPAAGASSASAPILVMLLILALVMTGVVVVPLLLVEEKERRTLAAVLVSPAREREVVAGKAIAGVVYLSLNIGALAVLDHSWSTAWLTLLAALAAGAVFMVAVGVLLGSLLHNTMQVNAWSGMVVLVLLAPTLVGATGLPAGAAGVVQAMPMYQLQRALEQALIDGAAVDRIAGSLAVLAGGAAVATGAATWALRRSPQ